MHYKQKYFVHGAGRRRQLDIYPTEDLFYIELQEPGAKKRKMSIVFWSENLELGFPSIVYLTGI